MNKKLIAHTKKTIPVIITCGIWWHKYNDLSAWEIIPATIYLCGICSYPFEMFLPKNPQKPTKPKAINLLLSLTIIIISQIYLTVIAITQQEYFIWVASVMSIGVALNFLGIAIAQDLQEKL